MQGEEGGAVAASIPESASPVNGSGQLPPGSYDSMLLQYGCPAHDIAHAMKRNPDGSPASPLGRAAAFLIEEDR